MKPKNMRPCLWFDTQAEEAAKFYASLFPGSKIGKIHHFGPSAAEISGQKEGSVITVELELLGQKITCLNGGPLFKFTPAMSFFVSCETEAEIDELWKKLSEGGEKRMELGAYPWGKKFGWVADRFGLDWQLKLDDGKREIVPALLFVDGNFGRGEEAARYYTSLFQNSKIESESRDPESRSFQSCTFTLNGNGFALMEGPGSHGFTFNEAFSIEVHCETQAEIDSLWDKIAADGSPSQCGWVTDKYGVCWQIMPSFFDEIAGDTPQYEAMMAEMLKMQKLDLEKLKKAYFGTA